jgi:predicted O-methyltransferase YrrM
MTRADARATQPLTLDAIADLYRTYQQDLRRVRDDQRELLRQRGTTMRTQLDDLEAELTYLRLRAHRPETVVEIGALHGWSTTWILSALRDNGTGHLHTFDLIDEAIHQVPRPLSARRWTFTKGEARRHVEPTIPGAGYLFIDADHGRRFAIWYAECLLPRLMPGTPVSVHDVYHGRRPKPFSEGAVVTRWLSRRGVDAVTLSGARAPGLHRRVLEIKRELGLDEPLRRQTRNPMIFFTSP